MNESPDRIEKRVHLKAPRSRVWRAISESTEFGSWFGIRLAQPFRPGELATAELTDQAYAGMKFELWVEAIEPETRFAYRWHPYAVDQEYDYSAEPTTLVEFFLEDADGGTMLTVVESGFDAVPLARRPEAFRMNTRGWEMQMEAIARYVDG